METFFDINNQEIKVGDTIVYDDVDHNLFQTTGVVRKNLIDVFEVINIDLQSGNDLANITNITLCQ